MATNPTTRSPLTIDDLADVQSMIGKHRHLIAAAKAGHYTIQAHPGQDEAFPLIHILPSIHQTIEEALYRAAADIREELLQKYNVEIGKGEA